MTVTFRTPEIEVNVHDMDGKIRLEAIYTCVVIKDIELADDLSDYTKMYVIDQAKKAIRDMVIQEAAEELSEL